MKIIKIKSGALHIESKNSILRSAEYENFLTAQKAIHAANNDARSYKAQAVKLHKKARQQGYAEGVALAKQNMLEQHITFVALAVKFTAELENKLCQIIKNALAKIIGKMDIDDITKHIIHNALATYGILPEIKLLVTPSQENIARTEVENLTQQCTNNSTIAPTIKFVSIETHQNLQKGECILESPLGSVNASLETQLTALRAAIDTVPHKNILLANVQEKEKKNVSS